MITLAKRKGIWRRRKWLTMWHVTAWPKWDEGKEVAIRFGSMGIGRNLDKSSPSKAVEKKVQ